MASLFLPAANKRKFISGTRRDGGRLLSSLLLSSPLLSSPLLSSLRLLKQLALRRESPMTYRMQGDELATVAEARRELAAEARK